MSTGGGRPLFGITWGAQGGFGRQLIRLLEETCRARSLELRHGDGRARQ